MIFSDKTNQKDRSIWNTSWLSEVGKIALTITIIVIYAIALLATTKEAVKTQDANTYTTIPNPCAGTPGISKMATSGNQIYVVCQGLEASPIIVLQNQEARQ